jgi:hypothetical protein
VIPGGSAVIPRDSDRFGKRVKPFARRYLYNTAHQTRTLMALERRRTATSVLADCPVAVGWTLHSVPIFARSGLVVPVHAFPRPAGPAVPCREN